MTSVEALRAVNEADRDVKVAFEKYTSQALHTGIATEETARIRVKTVTAAVAIVSLVVGFIMLVAGVWYFGIPIIGVGVYGGVKYNENKSVKIERIKDDRQKLETTINKNKS